MISAPACQEAAPSRLCVMQDMDVSHRSVRSLHPDLSTTLPLRARSLCLTASLTPRRSWIKCRLLDKLCGEPFVQPRVHLSDPRHRRPSEGCALRALKDSAIPCQKDVDILNTRRHVSSRTRAVAWHPGLQLQVCCTSQARDCHGSSSSRVSQTKSTVKDISHSNLHVGFDTKSSDPNSHS
jgi:hypothetical protein